LLILLREKTLFLGPVAGPKLCQSPAPHKAARKDEACDEHAETLAVIRQLTKPDVDT
jgi:hypothetical protein